MNRMELYREVNNFYQIRGDSFAKNYILTFVKMVSENNVKIEDFENWLLQNENNIKFDFRGKNKKQYNKVLRQFVRYLNAICGLNNPQQKNNKRKTRIYETYHEMKFFSR